MKRLLIILVTYLVLLTNCTKTAPFTQTITGNWIATEWSNDIGCGCTPFSTIPAGNNYYFNFKPNAEFQGNYLFGVDSYNRYVVVDSTRLYLYKNNTTDTLHTWYSFTNGNEVLQISFPCIEGCRVRLKRN